jgi:hypothetical protein
METQAINLELLTALRDLQTQLHAHIKLDVKKHYSLLCADAAASTAVHKATNAIDRIDQLILAGQ